jgi:hypothetical protein
MSQTSRVAEVKKCVLAVSQVFPRRAFFLVLATCAATAPANLSGLLAEAEGLVTIRAIVGAGAARRNNRFCFPHASPEMQTAELLAVAAIKVFKFQLIEWWARQGSNL